MSQRVRVKICGVTSVEDALLAADLGADAIGLNFYEKSARKVAPNTAANIAYLLQPFVDLVGVFVNVSWQQLSDFAGIFRLRTLQWHGDKPLELLAEQQESLRLVPAFRVASPGDLNLIQEYLRQATARAWRPPAILVDAQVPGQYGGTGVTAPWELLAEFKPTAPLILAGGLTPDNVAEAIRIVRPYAVDVASGVESSSGKKDADKMKRFIENARAALG